MPIGGPLKWHGGKTYLASRIVAMMPPHVHYVEPYFGGGAVLLAKNPEGVSEVVNDIDQSLTNFWRVLQGEYTFPEFVRQVQAVPFSESEFNSFVEAGDLTEDYPVDSAVNFFIRCRQSLAGRMESFATLSRTRTRRGMNEQASAWLNAVDGLPAVHARLKRVIVLNRDALDVIRGQDGPDTLFYLDPPYLHETRATTGEYAHEMTAEQHGDLLALIRDCRGKVMISGYNHLLYRQMLQEAGWHRTEFDLPNHAAGGASKRRMTECVWANFKPA